jgi:hypothetical protein
MKAKKKVRTWTEETWVAVAGRVRVEPIINAAKGVEITSAATLREIT